MGKSTPKFVNGIFVFLLVLTACSGKEMPKDEKGPAETKKDSEVQSQADTVWLNEEVTLNRISSWSLDTSFLYEGEQVLLNLSLRPLDAPFQHTKVWEQNDTTFAIKLQGPQFELSAVANSMQDDYLMSTLITKDDLVSNDNAPYLAADSYTTFDFLGYHKEFDAILLRAFIGYPNTDRGVMEYIFLRLDGKIKKQITDGYSFDLCDCDSEPSPDGRTFSFCKGVLHSNYQLIKVERETPLAGIFQLNDKHSLAIYMFEGKPPYTNLKVLGRTGSVLKSYSFEGINGEMGYRINHAWVGENEFFVLVDDVKQQLMVFDPKRPFDPNVLKFESLESTPEYVKEEGEHHHFWSVNREIELYYLNGEFLIDVIQ